MSCWFIPKPDSFHLPSGAKNILSGDIAKWACFKESWINAIVSRKGYRYNFNSSSELMNYDILPFLMSNDIVPSALSATNARIFSSSVSGYSTANTPGCRTLSKLPAYFFANFIVYSFSAFFSCFFSIRNMDDKAWVWALCPRYSFQALLSPTTPCESPSRE